MSAVGHGVAQEVREHLRHASMVDVDRLRQVEPHLYVAVRVAYRQLVDDLGDGWLDPFAGGAMNVAVRVANLHLVDDLGECWLDPFAGGAMNVDTAAETAAGEVHQVVDQSTHATDALAHEPEHSDRLGVGVHSSQDVGAASETS